MYQRVYWKDHVVDPGTGQIIQQGTLQDQAHLNPAEIGLSDAYIAQVLFAIFGLETRAEAEAEVTTVSLTNSQNYPFNDSQQSVALGKLRATTNYTVEPSVLSHEGGPVGSIIISEKALNGFKVQFDGSATSASVALVIRGGMDK